MSGWRVLASASLVLALGTAGAAQQSPPRGDAARSVTLSLAEYNRLIDLVDHPAPVPEKPPVPVVVAAADLAIRVDNGVARGVFTLTGAVFRNGLTHVPLAGSTLIAASANGNPVPLVTGNGTHALLGPGPFSLTVGWGTPLAVGAGRASFPLPVPKAGSARATLDLPGDQADVRVTPGVISSRTVVNGRTMVDVTLDPGSAAAVSWSMRDSVQAVPTREVRATADVLTLVTLGDSDVRMAALVDVNVLQGELRTIAVRLPAGYELTSVTGSSIATSTAQGDGVVLTIGDPAARSHQFLVSLERPHAGGSFALETAVLTLPDIQRTRGEIAVEGVGTLELTADGRDGLHRIDVRELSASLQSLTAWPLLAGFRYRQPGSAAPTVALDVKRFADAGVLAAIADRADATTLVTGEGRILTEVKLSLQNRAQPFLKVLLPAGASMVSVDVAGESAKPVAGVDGTRVPLLRPGFRPSGPYEVSFVYLHAGAPLARKGDMPMTLPRMDIPVSVVHWEVFVPDRYSAQAVAGNAIDLRRYSSTTSDDKHGSAGIAGVGDGLSGGGAGGTSGGTTAASAGRPHVKVSAAAGSSPGQIRGRAVDPRGAAIPGVTVTLHAGNQRKTATTSSNGDFLFSDVPIGAVAMTAALPGFNGEAASIAFDGRPRDVYFELHPGSLQETVTATAQSLSVDKEGTAALRMVPETVIALQRRTSGVLPIRIDVPRAGTSHRFVKPLVIDQETTVTLRYKRR